MRRKVWRQAASSRAHAAADRQTRAVAGVDHPDVAADQHAFDRIAVIHRRAERAVLQIGRDPVRRRETAEADAHRAVLRDVPGFGQIGLAEREHEIRFDMHAVVVGLAGFHLGPVAVNHHPITHADGGARRMPQPALLRSIRLGRKQLRAVGAQIADGPVIAAMSGPGVRQMQRAFAVGIALKIDAYRQGGIAGRSALGADVDRGRRRRAGVGGRRAGKRQRGAEPSGVHRVSSG